MADGRVSQIQLPSGNTYSIRAGAIPYGEVDSTSTSTKFTATVPGITELVDGTCVLLRNGVVTSASGFTININGLGAKPSYNNMTTGTTITRDTTIFNINYTFLFVYSEDLVDGGAWICYRGYDANTNTIGYQLRGNSGTRPAADKGYRYRLWLSSLDNQSWVPINTSTATDATTSRSLNSRVIDPFGEIVYYSYNGTTNAAANLTATTIWQQYTLTIGYSYVKSLTAWDPVYLKCEPQTSGGAVMKDIVQALPSTADGFIYIYLGIAYSTTAIELRFYHPVYYHDGTRIRVWTGATSFSGSYNDLTDKPDLFSGSYNDLTDKPTIPVLPNNIVNTITTTAGAHTTLSNETGDVSFSVPTKTSHLTNDSGFLTSSDIASVMKYKGTKASVANLPTSDNTTGDVWHITADGSEYAWDGSVWQELGTAIDLSDYLTADDLTSSTITSALGYTPYNSTNPNGYITASHTSTYSLPLAANGTRGGVQIGYSESGKNYAVKLSSEKMYVNVPWTDSDISTLTLATDTGTSSITLASEGKYKLTAGTKTVIFTMPTIPTVPSNIVSDVQYNTVSKTLRKSVNGAMSDVVSLATLKSDMELKTSDLTNDSGFLTSYTETDPIFSTSAAADITSDDISNWNSKTSNTGTVTSVAISNGGGLTVSGSPITTSGTITISHADTSSQASVTASDRTYIKSVTLDTYGHVTGLTTGTETVTDTNTTYTLSNALASHKFTSTLTAGGSGSGTSTATIEFVAGTGISLTDDTTNKKITIACTVSDTDTKVTNTLGTTTKYYVTGTTSTSTNTGTQTFDTGIYATTTAGQLNATTYKVDEQVTMQWNSTTSSLDYIFA